METPTRRPAERRRTPLSVRVKKQTRDALLARSAADDRSLTTTAEMLIEQALFTEQMMGKGSRIWLDALVSFERAGSQRAEELGFEGDWWRNPDCYMVAVAQALRRLLELAPGRWDGEQWHLRLNNALLSVQQHHANMTTQVSDQ